MRERGSYGLSPEDVRAIEGDTYRWRSVGSSVTALQLGMKKRASKIRMQGKNLSTRSEQTSFLGRA